MTAVGRSSEFEGAHQRASRLSDADRISVAEQVMERAGQAGQRWHVPALHYDDPARAEVHRPVHEYVNGVLTAHGHPGGIRVHPKDWDLRNGGGQAYTDGSKIALAGESTNSMTLLHECAHILTRTNGHHGHGPEFGQVLHGLYAEHLGPEPAQTFANLAMPPRQ